MPSKRFEKATTLVDRNAPQSLERAVSVLKGFPPTKFNETVQLSVSLTIDPKKSDQIVRGTVTLPHGTGKTRRVVVFCKSENERLAREAGADAVGAAELIQRIQDGWMEFDVAVATPDLMRDVSRLGKLLGPRGLMPNPKAGTVTDDVVKAINEVRQGKVEVEMDKLSNIHFVVGKLSFKPQQLVENSQTALDAIVRSRPSSVKGRMIKRVVLSSTMSPGVPVTTDGLEAGLAQNE